MVILLLLVIFVGMVIIYKKFKDIENSTKSFENSFSSPKIDKTKLIAQDQNEYDANVINNRVDNNGNQMTLTKGQEYCQYDYKEESLIENNDLNKREYDNEAETLIENYNQDNMVQNPISQQSETSIDTALDQTESNSSHIRYDNLEKLKADDIVGVSDNTSLQMLSQNDSVKKKKKKKNRKKNKRRNIESVQPVEDEELNDEVVYPPANWQEQWKELLVVVWPKCKRKPPEDFFWDSAFLETMEYYPKYKELYELYEKLLIDYPHRYSDLQQKWILDAIKRMFSRANYIEYTDDNAIFEEYKYICSSTKIHEIFIKYVKEFPSLAAAMASWSFYQCNFSSLKEMLSVFDSLSECQKDEFTSQLIDSLTRVRAEIFDHSLSEIKAVINELNIFVDDLLLNDEEKASYSIVEKYLRQGYSVKEVLVDIQDKKIWKKKSKMNKENSIQVFFQYPNGKQGDIDKFLATEYGSGLQLESGLVYSTRFEGRNLQYAEWIIYSLFYHNLPYKFEGFNIHNKAVYEILAKYNNYHTLRDLIFSVKETDKYYLSEPYKTAELIYRRYLHFTVSASRDKVYSKLIVEGKSTSRWKSEQQVYALAAQKYPDAIYQYRSEWLGLQSLDVFIPSLSIGIEYQGQQHYEPIDYFGGSLGFERLVERDKRKRKLCKENNIKLIYWKYDEPINLESLVRKLGVT